MALRKQIQNRLRIIESCIENSAYKSEEALYKAARTELEWVLDQMEENRLARGTKMANLNNPY